MRERDGGELGRKKPPPSHVSSKGGDGWWLEGRNSLHLVFQARERDGGGLGRKKPPLSHVLSEGGDGWWLETSFQPDKEGNTLLVASKHVVCR